jgi:hypothetical protein
MIGSLADRETELTTKMLFGRKGSRGAAAVAEGPPKVTEARALAEAGDVDHAIEVLADANRASRSLEVEREFRRLRHVEGVRLLDEANGAPSYADPAGELPEPGSQSRISEVTPDELTPGLLRASMLEYGCLLVRGLTDPGAAERMAHGIDRAFEVREGLGEGESDPDGYYDELIPESGEPIEGRAWVQEGGGVLAADSPRLFFEMLEGFDAAGLDDLIRDYLGERPTISAQKCTLRKATPDVGGAWHQDGRFLGDVRSVNVWLSNTLCGDEAHSLDLNQLRLNKKLASGN